MHLSKQNIFIFILMLDKSTILMLMVLFTRQVNIFHNLLGHISTTAKGNLCHSVGMEVSQLFVQIFFSLSLSQVMHIWIMPCLPADRPTPLLTLLVIMIPHLKKRDIIGSRNHKSILKSDQWVFSLHKECHYHRAQPQCLKSALVKFVTPDTFDEDGANSTF